MRSTGGSFVTGEWRYRRLTLCAPYRPCDNELNDSIGVEDETCIKHCKHVRITPRSGWLPNVWVCVMGDT